MNHALRWLHGSLNVQFWSNIVVTVALTLLMLLMNTVVKGWLFEGGMDETDRLFWPVIMFAGWLTVLLCAVWTWWISWIRARMEEGRDMTAHLWVLAVLNCLNFPIGTVIGGIMIPALTDTRTAYAIAKGKAGREWVERELPPMPAGAIDFSGKRVGDASAAGAAEVKVEERPLIAEEPVVTTPEASTEASTETSTEARNQG